MYPCVLTYLAAFPVCVYVNLSPLSVQVDLEGREQPGKRTKQSLDLLLGCSGRENG